jgi:AcrR family transcriptional regulator
VSNGEGAERTTDAATAAPVPADPRQGLSTPALNILQAAQRVLVEKGFSGLTLRAIAAESGENSAMVQYYFGNKEGLVKAMIDSVFRDEQLDAAAALGSATSEDRLLRFVDGLRTISRSRSYRVFFDILPYALRNAGLHERMAGAYDSYRSMKRDWLCSEEEAPDEAAPGRALSAEEAAGECAGRDDDLLLGVAGLMTAIIDGLAMQEAIDPAFDVKPAFAILEFMLQRSLPELLETGLPEEAAAGR